jgi:hypothetical protein
VIATSVDLAITIRHGGRKLTGDNLLINLIAASTKAP